MTTVTLPPTSTTARDVNFVEPMLGFPGVAAFTLDAIDPDGVLLSLRSVDDPGLRFVLTPAEVFFPDYRPDLDAALAGTLGGDDLEVLLMLTIGSGLPDSTANLRAPVALCASTGRAVQVILDDADQPMRQPLITR